jgi:hypothetical protein
MRQHAHAITLRIYGIDHLVTPVSVQLLLNTFFGGFRKFLGAGFFQAASQRTNHPGEQEQLIAVLSTGSTEPEVQAHPDPCPQGKVLIESLGAELGNFFTVMHMQFYGC